MMKSMIKHRTLSLLVLVSGIVLLTWFVNLGRENETMSDIFLSFILEIIFIFIVLFVTVFLEVKLNHRFSNGILIISLLILMLAYLFNFQKDIFMFMTINLVLYMIYFSLRHKALLNFVKRLYVKLVVTEYVLQNYQKRRA